MPLIFSGDTQAIAQAEHVNSQQIVDWIRAVVYSMKGAYQVAFLGMPREDIELILRIRARKLTYLSEKKLHNLLQTCRELEKKNISGSFVEAGCALGGSTILIASVKSPSRPFFVYDVFGMIPPPTEEDDQDAYDHYRIIQQGRARGIGRNKYYGYEENLLEVVQSNLKKFGIDYEQSNIRFVKGLVQDTMRIDQPVAFAHIDVDWYEPVKTCLERIVPNLAVGGAIILDDYHYWSGCRKATDEYFKPTADEFQMDDSAGSLKITRVIK